MHPHKSNQTHTRISNAINRFMPIMFMMCACIHFLNAQCAEVRAPMSLQILRELFVILRGC